MLNAFSWIFEEILDTAESIYDYGQEHVKQTLKVVIAAALSPLAFFIAGLLAGLIDGKFGRGVHLVGLFVSIVLVAVVLLRAKFFKELFLFGTKLGDSFWKKLPLVGKRIELPLPQQKTVDGWYDWLMSSLVWTMSASVFAITIDVYDDPFSGFYLFALGAIVALMAAIKWFNGPVGRFCYRAMVVGNFLVVASWVVTPDYVRRWTEDKKVEAKAYFDRSHQLATVDAKYAPEETQVAKETYESLKSERLKLMKDARKKCGGQICVGDKEDLAKINAALRAIDGNTWLEETVEEEKKPPATAAAAPTAPAAPPPSAGRLVYTEEDSKRVLQALEE